MDQVGKAIHSAQSEIMKLNDRLRLLSSGNRLNENSYATYATVIQYNMLKAQTKIEQTFQSILNQSAIQKTKLPTIKAQSTHQRNNISMNGIAKTDDFKKPLRLKSIRREDRLRVNSTKDQISIPVDNRPVKMHSFIQKHVRNNIFTDDKPISKIQPPSNSQKPSNINIQFMSESISSKHQKMLEQIARSQLSNEQIEIQIPEMILTIMNGNVLITNNQYHAFAHVYQTILPKINELLKKLLKLFKDNNIKDVTLKGRVLAQVAINDEPMKNLIECIIQREPRQLLLKRIEKYDGKEGKANAASLIQALWRMSSIRREYLEFKHKVLIIQRYAKKYILKIKLKRSMKERSHQIYETFNSNQSKLGQNLQRIQSSPHVELHINGYGIEELKRLTTSNLEQKKNIQLTRLFRLKNPNISIIYVTSHQLSIEVITYYYRTLELLNIDYHGRLFLFPEANASFPYHFPTSKLLYYSPKCLAKIKELIKNKQCLLVPGYPCSEDIKLSYTLNCYLLSTDPLKSKVMSTKYQSRSICISAGLPVLPAVTDFSGLQEMINIFGISIIKNPSVKTWLFKIDDETDGRGIAWYTIGKSIHKLLKEIIPEDNASQFFSLTNANEVNNVDPHTLASITEILTKSLPSKLRIAMPSLFINYSQYMQTFLRKGGIIEASPSQFQTKSCSISFFLSPEGYEIINTYTKLQNQPYLNVACKSPQQTLSYATIHDCCQRISQSLRFKGGLGFHTLDLLVVKNRNSNFYNYFAIGLDTYLNNYTSSFFYFDALMNGRYLVEQNCYLIQSKSETESRVSSLEEVIEPRKYIYSPYTYNPYFYKTSLKTFFKSAKYADINYDFSSHEGVCILVMDEATSGVFGLLSIYESDEDLVVGMYNATQFIDKSSEGDKKQIYSHNAFNSRKDAILASDVLSLFSRLKQRKERENGKAKIRKIQSSKNHLEFI